MLSVEDHQEQRNIHIWETVRVKCFLFHLRNSRSLRSGKGNKSVLIFYDRPGFVNGTKQSGSEAKVRNDCSAKVGCFSS